MCKPSIFTHQSGWQKGFCAHGVLIYPGWVKSALVQTIDFHPPKWLAEGVLCAWCAYISWVGEKCTCANHRFSSTKVAGRRCVEKNRSKWPIGSERSLLQKWQNGRSQSPRSPMAPLLLRPNRLPFQKAQPKPSPCPAHLYWREIYIPGNNGQIYLQV